MIQYISLATAQWVAKLPCFFFFLLIACFSFDPLFGVLLHLKYRERAFHDDSRESGPSLSSTGAPTREAIYVILSIYLHLSIYLYSRLFAGEVHRSGEI